MDRETVRRRVSDRRWARVSSFAYGVWSQGAAAFFARPQAELETSTRFPLWCQDVIARLKNPDDIVAEINRRAGSLFDGDDDAFYVREALLDLLGYHDKADAVVFLPNSLIARWFSQHTVNDKSKWSGRGVGQYLKRMMDDPLLLELEPKHTNSARGYIWRGSSDEKTDFSLIGSGFDEPENE